MNPTPLAYKKFACAAGVFTDLVAPIDCNSFSFKSQGGLALTVRTNKADASTEDTVPAGYQEGVEVPRMEAVQAFRYRANDVIISVNPPAPDMVVLKVSL